ncbi:MAG: hypothetical protein NDJ89_17975 [Oligoflexia bacterium]|nr:hypothetical protein [Oligoflexia bacterium]
MGRISFLFLIFALATVLPRFGLADTLPVTEPAVSDHFEPAERQALEGLLDSGEAFELIDQAKGADRKPAVLGAATTLPTERPELYTDTIPETSIESIPADELPF